MITEVVHKRGKIYDSWHLLPAKIGFGWRPFPDTVTTYVGYGMPEDLESAKGKYPGDFPLSEVVVSIDVNGIKVQILDHNRYQIFRHEESFDDYFKRVTGVIDDQQS